MGPSSSAAVGDDLNPGQTSVRCGRSVRRERSLKFREFGLYAAKISPDDSTTTNTIKTTILDARRHAYPTDEEQSSEYSTTVSTFPTPSPFSTTTTRTTTTTTTTTNSTDTNGSFHTTSPPYDHSLSFGAPTPSPPRSPISPRWDSLAHSTTVIYDHTIAASAAAGPSSTAPSTPTGLQYDYYEDDDDEGEHDYELESSLAPLASESRDVSLPSLPSPRTKMTAHESRPSTSDTTHVENFSRPRRPSVKQPSPEPLRYRPAHAAGLQSDPTLLETSTHHLWPRERNQSISSNKSTSTFASLPVRPSGDLYSRDSLRGRSRHANPPLARPALAYNRGESSGPSFARDPMPRMASMPSDELRSSFRSQLSASTTPGTLQTARSSVLTKTSSVTSMYGPVDDEFSVDDVMGIYEKGFRDDSPAPTVDYHEYDSRPPTAGSELSRRRAAMLEALSDSLPVQAGEPIRRSDLSADAYHSADADRSSTTANTPEPPTPNGSNLTIVRDSAAIFRNSGTLSPTVEDEEPISNEAKHDSGKVIAHDGEDFPPRAQKPQLARLSLENTDVTRDQYGFRKQNQYVTQEQYDAWNAGYSDYIDRRRRKWNAFLKENGLMTDSPNRFPPRSAKTKRFIRKGIPPEWRGAAWFYYAGGPAILAKHGGVYDDLLQQTAKDVDNEAIERDLHRTFPDNLKFRTANASTVPNTEDNSSRNSHATVTEPQGNEPRPDETPMISSLRRVLHAFSIYNPRIGYCQSLNFLAGLLLLFCETEEQAFWLLNIITRVYLPGTHEMSLEGANVDLGVLMASIQEVMPAVWGKIAGELDGTDAAKPKSRRQRKGAVAARLPPVTLCMTAWFMSCFIGTLPIETTLRVWDVFFYEGSKTLFRIALAIFKLGENEIRSVGDPMEIFQVVQTIPRRLVDANGLMEACFRRRNGFGHLSQETIEQRRDERRSNVKLEKEKIATGLSVLDDASESKRKNTLFGKIKRPAEVM